jgi:hypothetical protein
MRIDRGEFGPVACRRGWPHATRSNPKQRCVASAHDGRNVVTGTCCTRGSPRSVRRRSACSWRRSRAPRPSPSCASPSLARSRTGGPHTIREHRMGPSAVPRCAMLCKELLLRRRGQGVPVVPHVGAARGAPTPTTPPTTHLPSPPSPLRPLLLPLNPSLPPSPEARNGALCTDTEMEAAPIA